MQIKSLFKSVFQVTHFLIRQSYLFSKELASQFFKDQCTLRASGLAFSTLLALVPFSALVIALLNAFGTLDQATESLRDFLINTLVPTQQDTIMEYITQFTQNTRAMGAVGLLFFIFSAVLLFNNIDKNINELWNSSGKRPFLVNFSIYVSLIFLGTLLIAASFSIRPMLENLLQLDGTTAISPLLNFLLDFMPLLFILIILLLINIIIPSVPVHFFPAFIAALCGSIFFQIARFAFTVWVNASVQWSLIYGSLAVIPIFIIWLYLLWLIILLSVEICFVLSSDYLKERQNEVQSPSILFQKALLICQLCGKNHLLGHNPPSIAELALESDLSKAEIFEIAEKLKAKGIVSFSNDSPQTILFNHSPETIKLSFIFEAFWGDSSLRLWKRELKRLYREVKEDFPGPDFSRLENQNLAQLLQPLLQDERFREAPKKRKRGFLAFLR